MAFSPYDLPRNQRLLMRRRNQAAAQNLAVPSAAEEDVVAQIAAEDANRQQWGAEMAMNKEQFGSRLGLGTRRLDLATKRFEYGKEQFDTNVGLQRDAMGTMSKQNRYATGIGIANLGVSGLGAYADVKAADADAARIQKLEAGYMDMTEMARVFIQQLQKQKGQ